MKVLPCIRIFFRKVSILFSWSESLIEAGGVTDEHIVEVGNGHWIKLEGETAINNVLLTKKENGTLSLQLKGSDSTEGTIYVPNVQGWKDGDWQ